MLLLLSVGLIIRLSIAVEGQILSQWLWTSLIRRSYVTITSIILPLLRTTPILVIHMLVLDTRLRHLHIFILLLLGLLRHIILLGLSIIILIVILNWLWLIVYLLRRRHHIILTWIHYHIWLIEIRNLLHLILSHLNASSILILILILFVFLFLIVSILLLGHIHWWLLLILALLFLLFSYLITLIAFRRFSLVYFEYKNL